MDGEDRHCSVEECEDNQDGLCQRQMDGPMGYAAAAFYMPMQTNFMAPFGPTQSFLMNSTLTDGQPQMAGGMWRNCPRRKDQDKKK